MDQPIDNNKLPVITPQLIKDRYAAAFKKTKEARTHYNLNDCFLEGNQWLNVDRESERISRFSDPDGRIQVTINKLDNLVATYLGKADKSDYEFSVPPSTADDYALEGARVAESIINWKYDDCFWADKKEEIMLAALKGGTAAITTEWDVNAKSYGVVNTGDTIERVLNITQFALETGSRDLQSARWWIRAEALPVEQARSVYQLDYTPKDDADLRGPFADTLRKHNGEKGCLVLTYYERPNHLNKEGTVAVVIGDKFVNESKPWPFKFKNRLNISIVKETIVDNQWWGSTRLNKARSLQVAYNAVHSNIQENIKALGTSKLVIPAGSSEVVENWSTDPSEPIIYPDGSTAPGYLTAPSLPAYISNYIDKLENDMQDIMGVHAISQGEAPVNLESGFALRVLAENDASPATSLARRTARAFEIIASLVLQQYETNVKDTRKATVYEGNTSSVATTVQWSGKTIAGQTKVVIPDDAVVPHSAAAAQQFAETVAKMGLLPPGQTGLTMLLELAEIPNRNDTMWLVNAPEARARHNVALILQGMVVIPEPFQNHALNIEVANRARLSPRYDTLTPEIKNALDAYVQANETMAAEQAGNQVARASVSPALSQAPTANQEAPLPPEMLGIGNQQPQGGTASPQLGG